MRKGPSGVVSSASPPVGAESKSKPTTLSEIQRLQRNRDERRRAMEQAKQERAAEEQRNRESGNPGDVDFQRMIRQWRADQAPPEREHLVSKDLKICICVRKRPINSKEIKRLDHDSVTCLHPIVVVHDCKLKVDGISKYLDNQSFQLDHTFHEENTTEDIYYTAVESLVSFVLGGGRGTVFAYGQTGSGKTFTMVGIQSLLVDDLFKEIEARRHESNITVLVSFFEIYGGRCQDLLNNRQRLNVREDGSGEVVVGDILEVEASTASDLQGIIDTGNRNRTTHATDSNDVSSRSHAICQISVRDGDRNNKEIGRLSLIDLAGSERGADTKSHNRQRRMEGAEINKSLLALKECIRALDAGNSAAAAGGGGANAAGGGQHVPYRGSKLTLVLKDSFTRHKSRTVMITCISPAASSADHTINTLRYADRIKERTVSSAPSSAGAGGASRTPPPSKAPASNAAQPKAAAALAGNKPPMAPGAGAQGRDFKAGYKAGPPAPASAASGFDDDDYLDDRLDSAHDNEEEEDEEELQQTIEDLFEAEEELLNLHMNVIQENAELLTEEGRLLQLMQGEDNDIDAYAARLDEILVRKQELIVTLREKLASFRRQLVLEETVSLKVRGKNR